MKKKTIAFVGMVVCAILLTSPVLTSAGYSKIYGNANEDDTLDMRDITYIKLVIFGKKPETTLTDANADGKISMLDIGQTKLIILDKEKELTLIDQADRTVTIPRPIERVVSTRLWTTRVILALDGCDRLIASEVGSKGHSWSTMSCVGELQFACGGKIAEIVEDVGWGGTNVEKIATLRPDVIFGGTNPDSLQEQTGAPVVVSMLTHRPATMTIMEWWSRQIECVGEVLGREEEAEDLISFMEEKIALVTDITSQIDDSEKPRVYWASRASGSQEYTRTDGHYDPIELAGGINVAKDAAPAISEFSVSKEQIIAWHPDILLIKSLSINPSSSAYSSGQHTIEMALSDPEFQAGNVSAVKTGAVYYAIGHCRHYNIQRFIPETMYLAKIFYPEKFKDLDLEKEGNEVIEKFFGEEGLYTWFADDSGYLRDFIENPPEEKEW